MSPQKLIILTLFCAQVAMAGPLRDHGIDPEHLGKGDWISFFQFATNNFRDPNSPPDIRKIKSVIDIPSVLAYEKSLGMDYVIVKAGTGSTNYMLGRQRQFTTNLVQQAHAVGLKIFGYTRSYGADVPGEIELATYVFNCGADGFVIDAEAEWESNRPWIGKNGPAKARQLCEGIRARFPNKFLAHSPMPIISYHRSFPMKEFGLYCDAVMPQLYWRSFKKTPTETVQWMDREWERWHASLSGSDTNAIKPIVPVGPGGPGMQAGEVIEFMNYLKSDPLGVTATGYRGVNFFRAGRYPFDVLRVFNEITFSDLRTSYKSFHDVRVKDLTDTSAVIQWQTRVAGKGAIDFGTTTDYGRTLPASTAGRLHTVAVSNLKPDTIYHFRVRPAAAIMAEDMSGDFLLMTRKENPLSEIILDNAKAELTGAWTIASNAADRFGPDYAYRLAGSGTGYAEFVTNAPVSGRYQIYEMHTAATNRSTATPHIVSVGSHTRTNFVDQSQRGGKWNLLHTVHVEKGQRICVRITDDAEDKRRNVIADAIKLTFDPMLAHDADLEKK